MDPSLLAVGWPGEPAVVLSAWRGGEWRTLATCGDLDDIRPWASVTKLVTGLCAAIDVEAGRATLDDPVGPAGSTLAHLLSHSSGLGFESADQTSAPGRKRVYSNYGVDLAAQYLAGGTDVATWLATRLAQPLELHSTRLVGRASEGLEGSTKDLATFARQWVTPSLIPVSRRDRTVQAFLPELSGVVPGWGRFNPCPWGLGPEVRGEKSHWMGEWPPSSFGHFGRSGAMVLINADEGLVLVATSTVEFGAWANEFWPAWTTRVRQWATTS